MALQSLEKKAGKNYGPPGTKHLIYFLDDLNMPEVDTYGTAGPHTLIRNCSKYFRSNSLHFSQNPFFMSVLVSKQILNVIPIGSTWIMAIGTTEIS